MTVEQSALPSLAEQSASKGSQPNLGSAAKQFESVLLSQWLQNAEESFASVPGTQEEDAGGQQMQGFATQQLATNLTEHGGIGIAKLVLGALSKAGEQEAAGLGKSTTTASRAAAAVAAYNAGGVR